MYKRENQVMTPIQRKPKIGRNYSPWFPFPSNPMKIKLTGTGRYTESTSISSR